MAERIAPYSALDWATFSIDATTVKTLNSAAATGHNITAAEAGGNKVVRVLVSCPGANLRFTTSGPNTPSAGNGPTITSSTGHKLLAGNVLQVDTDPWNFQFIAEVAGPNTVYVDYQAS